MEKEEILHKMSSVIGTLLVELTDYTTNDEIVKQIIGVGFENRFWKSTDPDNLQFLFKDEESNKNLIFRFREFNRTDYPEIYEKFVNGDEKYKDTDADIFGFYKSELWNDSSLWIEEEINLAHCTLQEKEDSVRPYYGTKALKEIDNNIIAECIFEQSTGLYG